MTGRRLVLASASPRRADLLRQAGLSFETRPSGIEETARPNEPAGDLAERLAREKAAAAAAHPSPALVIAADTLVVLGDDILAKPRDPDEARAMLSRLAGRIHEVITGLAIRTLPEEEYHTERVVSRVEFAPLTTAQIDWYVSTGEGADKAGAYALQGIGALIIRSVEGSYTNVIGLPLERLYPHLRRLHFLP